MRANRGPALAPVEPVDIFHCDHCDHLVFFENTQCIQCGHVLAYLPDLGRMGSLDPVDGGGWQAPSPESRRRYRLCANYADHNICNWAIEADDPNALCQSCRLTRLIPDLDLTGRREAWYRLEVAKRRLLYTLFSMSLPITNRSDDPDHGLTFEFVADRAGSDPQPAHTGHRDGVITINMAEADDAERERRRLSLGEPYRTLLGHFRHEIGHYYWDRLIGHTERLASFRELFGDERADYGAALKAHYDSGPPADWQQHFVSAYATTHPWEDWAETWAHYLHMSDAIGTAAACGISLRPRRTDEPALKRLPQEAASPHTSFDQLIASWFPLTYMLNNLNRGLGLPDGYPFVLSAAAIDKLRFVHDTIAASSVAS